MRCALEFMRFMFMSGRNKVIWPSAFLYAFMPSKTFVAYCRHELAGSISRGPYGLISGADHPWTGS